MSSSCKNVFHPNWSPGGGGGREGRGEATTLISKIKKDRTAGTVPVTKRGDSFAPADQTIAIHKNQA